MHAAVIALAACLLAVPNTVRAADDNAALVVGVWEITYCDAKNIPLGTKLEFTPNGKLNMTVQVDGKEMTVDGGGYKVDNDALTLTGKDGKKNDKGRICLLNKSSLVINDEIEDKVMVLKRVKK